MTFSTFDENRLCNIALSGIGGGSINSIIDPVVDLEATCANVYSSLIPFLLSFNWNWTNTEAELAKNLDITPLREFESAFRLPADLSSGPVAVYIDGVQRAQEGYWKIKGTHLYCNGDVVIIDYVGGADVSTWPPFFRRLAIKALQADLAIPVRDNEQLEDQLRREAYGPPEMEGRGGLMGVALRIDAQSKGTKTMFKNGDPFTSARFGGFPTARG